MPSLVGSEMCIRDSQDAEPAPRGGPGCGVRVLGVLRCSGSGAGEVRDGAPGRGGGDRGERRRALVRVLAAVLLQRRGGVGRWRTAGAGAGLSLIHISEPTRL